MEVEKKKKILPSISDQTGCGHCVAEPKDAALMLAVVAAFLTEAKSENALVSRFYRTLKIHRRSKRFRSPSLRRTSQPKCSISALDPAISQSMIKRVVSARSSLP